MKKTFLFKAFLLLIAIVTGIESAAQVVHYPFTLTRQVRTRTEYRDGQATLRRGGAVPTFFTSQRTRLTAGYSAERFKVLTSIQDIRVWGMDGSTISNADGNRLF